MSILLRSVAMGIHYAVPHMKDRKDPCIVNTASVSEHRIIGKMFVGYAAAKAAVIHLTRFAAVELAEFGIRVNSVSPGFLVTPLHQEGGGSGDNAELIEVAQNLKLLRLAGTARQSGKLCQATNTGRTAEAFAVRSKPLKLNNIDNQKQI